MQSSREFTPEFAGKAIRWEKGTMIERIWSAIDWALGLRLDSEELGAGHMALRAAIVLALATVMVRFGSSRFIGRSTALDVMLAIILGSVISRAITGNAAFFPTLGAGVALVLLHWLLAAVAFRSHRFGNFVKGRPLLLVKDGVIDWKAMAQAHITEHDLQEAMRCHGHPPDVHAIHTAYLERNGDISIVENDKGRASR